MILSAAQHRAIEKALAELHAAQTQRMQGTSGQVDAILREIHANLLRHGLTVKMIKASTGITDNNIACRFKFEVGVTIKRYVEACRLELACVLLREGELSVAEVARLVGYAHPQTFYAVFSRERDCSPGAVRRGAQSRTPDNDDRAARNRETAVRSSRSDANG